MKNRSDRPRTPHEKLLAERARCFAAALAFQRAAPWATLNEFAIFGVQLDGDVEPMWCRVTDAEDGPPGVDAQFGHRGLHLMAAVTAFEYDVDDLLAERDSIAVYFDAVANLTLEERREVDASDLPFDREVGLPVILRHEPGRTRSQLTTEELRRARLVLEQAIVVAAGVAAGSIEHLPDASGARFVRVETAGEGDSTWRDARVVPPPPSAAEAPPFDAAALRGRTVAAESVWELDAFAYPFDEETKSGTRVTPFVAALAEGGDEGLVTADETQPRERFAAACELLLDQLARAEALPARVHVRRRPLAARLASLATAIGIAVELVDELPAIEAYRDELEDGPVED